MGVVDEYVVGFKPLTPECLEDWTGSRGLTYIDTLSKNYSIEGTWDGNHEVAVFPVACVNVNAPEFCYTMYVEHHLQALVLWELGRDALPYPGQIAPAQDPIPYPHTDGTPVTVRLDLIDNVLYCYTDNVLKFTQVVTSNLQDSTIAGVTSDRNRTSDHNTGFPLSTFSITPLPD